MYIIGMHSLPTDTFSHSKGIGDLLKLLVELKKQDHYQLLFRILKLTCLLPVATATVERMFSAIKIIKNHLRNRMRDEWMNDCLIVYTEKDVADTITNDTIITKFQNVSTKGGLLNGMSCVFW
ncbi:hypothetical protein KSP39_PZI021912 [Platanthera zijinensis]|uniref:HAT C-terminal dimerisation domain-containing protein n=1 Tax=Platanthera zijinensis TaxID=2320716 RepID=A0AAP0FW87_9ASPA